jgi:trigger factor
MPTLDTANIERTTTEIEPCHYTVKFDVPATEVNQAVKNLVNKYKSAKIPGFRPGKTPAALIRKRFDKEIMDEARQYIINESVQLLLTDDTVKPVTAPRIADDDVPQVTDNSDFSFSVEFDVQPEMELPELHGIKVAATVVQVTDSHVADYLDGLAKQQAGLEKVERAAAEDDILKVGYKAQMQADEAVPVSAQGLLDNEETWIRLTEPTDIPGLLSALTGKSAGDKTDVSITYPDDFREAFLATKTILYSFTIQEVHAVAPAELDDEFAKKMGLDDYEALKEAVRSQIESTQKQERNREIGDQIGKFLIDSGDFPLPPSVLKEETNRILYERMMEQRGAEPQSGQKMKDELEAMSGEADKDANERLTLRYTLQAISEKEQIKADDERVNMHAQMMMQQAQAQRQEADPQTIQQLAVTNATTDAVLEKLAEWAEITDIDRQD